jgi:predicted membrane channel-forming protein YqfA (hemolysin III family)
MPEEQPAGRIRDIRAHRPSFVGMVLLVCAPFLIFGANEVYGALATTFLFVVWLVLFAMGCRWFMPRPWRVVVVAALSLLAWLVVVLLAQ